MGYEKNLSDPTLEPNRLKNVTKFVPQKQSDPTLEPNGLANCHKWVVTKAYPNSVGLENCHKWGVTKNLSDICRTWFVSRSANLTQLVGLKLCHGLGKALFSCLKKIYV